LIVGVGVGLGLFRRVFCHGLIGFGLVIIFLILSLRKLKKVWIAAKLFGFAKTAPLSLRGLCPWQNDCVGNLSFSLPTPSLQ
jgi:hypothetical protein